MKRLGRPGPRVQLLRACAMVLAVSYASNGETSSETQPSTPSVALVDARPEEVGSLREILDRQLEEELLIRLGLLVLSRRMAVIVGLAFLVMAWSKMVGLEVSPVTDNSSM